MQSVIDFWVAVVVGVCSAFGHHLTPTVDHRHWNWAEKSKGCEQSCEHPNDFLEEFVFDGNDMMLARR